MTAPRWSTEDRVAALKWPEQNEALIREAVDWGDHEVENARMKCALLDAATLLDQGMKGVAMDVVIRAARAYREATA